MSDLKAFETGSAHPVKTKPPVRRLYADDLAVVRDGVTYFPHAGEWVELRPNTPVSAMARSLKLMAAFPDPAAITPAQAADLAETLEQAQRDLAGCIVAWNWTDWRGDPFPAPSAAVIGDLSYEELAWLAMRISADGLPA